MKKKKAGYPPGTQLRFDHVITHPKDQDISFESIDRIWDAYIEAIEKEGLSTGGGVSPITDENDE